MTDPASLTICVRAPAELIEKHGEDVLHTVYTIDLDERSISFDCKNDGTHSELPLDEDATALVGTMLLWALKQRLAAAARKPEYTKLELF